MARDPDRMQRSFWLHQLAEYLLGLVLVAMGVQSTTPVVPAVAGGLLVANAATVSGPFAAFALASRPVHRILDWLLVGVLALLAALPFLNIDNTTRFTMLGIAAVLGTLSWQTRYEPKIARPRPGDRPTSVGRTAGRGAATLVNMVRSRKRSE